MESTVAKNDVIIRVLYYQIDYTSLKLLYKYCGQVISPAPGLGKQSVVNQVD